MDNMEEFVFNELGTLINCFLVGSSCGIFLGFVVWVVRQMVILFKKFF